MKRALMRWGLFAACACVLALLALVLFERPAILAAEAVMGPWFALCRLATPSSWQVQGNILLGLMWLVSGVIVYSVVIGGACALVLALADKARGSMNPPSSGCTWRSTKRPP